MKIAWIGGIERSEARLRALAAEAGHELEFHSGAVSGGGASALRAILGRSELAVITTDVNSHGAVLLAKQICRTLGRRFVIRRRSSDSALRDVLQGEPASVEC